MSQITDKEKNILNLTALALFGEKKKLNNELLHQSDLSPELKEASMQAMFSIVYSVLKAHGVSVGNYDKVYLRTVASNIRVEHDHAELHQLLTKSGIPYVVLKGSASAMYYPSPILRMMGDVDFLVRKSDLQKAGMLLEKAGFVPVEKNENECHIAYHRKLNGIRSIWEMHWEPNGIPAGEYGELTRKYLEDIIEKAIPCTISGSQCMVPSMFHHGLIMLLHTASHLINTGVGLRHLCDWAVFVDKISDEDFFDMFEEKLKAIGMWRFAQILTQLSINYLGMPPREWCGVADQTYLETLMCDIFKGGNFGVKDSNRINQAKLLTNAHKGSVDETGLFMQFIRTMNEKAGIVMPITKRVSVLLPIGWGVAGTRHIFRIKSGKRPKIHVTDMVRGANERRELYKEFRLFQPEEVHLVREGYVACSVNEDTKNFLMLLKCIVNPSVSEQITGAQRPVNWESMAEMSKIHNLFPLFHEVACQYPEYKEEENYEDNISIALTTIAQQIRKTEAFLNLYRAFLEKDLHPIVMKGLICRQLYGKNAEKRPSSDEDILVRKDEFYKVKEFLEEQGFVCLRPDVTEAQLEKLQDVGFCDKENNFLIEVHTNLMGHANRLRTQMGDQFKDVFENARIQMVRGVPITTMSHTDHFLFLVLHAFKHFSLNGVGVRQMLDILLYQESFEQEINWTRVLDALKGNNALTYLGDLQFIGAAYLGFKFEKRVETCDPEGLLEDMMEVGVFGKQDASDVLAARINMNSMDKKQSRVLNMIRAGFPPVKYMMVDAPYLEEKPWLLPIEWVKRWGRFFGKARKYQGNLMMDGVKKSQKRMELLKKYGL